MKLGKRLELTDEPISIIKKIEQNKQLSEPQLRSMLYIRLLNKAMLKDMNEMKKYEDFVKTYSTTKKMVRASFLQKNIAETKTRLRNIISFNE